MFQPHTVINIGSSLTFDFIQLKLYNIFLHSGNFSNIFFSPTFSQLEEKLNTLRVPVTFVLNNFNQHSK